MCECEIELSQLMTETENLVAFANIMLDGHITCIYGKQRLQWCFRSATHISLQVQNRKTFYLLIVVN